MDIGLILFLRVGPPSHSTVGGHNGRDERGSHGPARVCGWWFSLLVSNRCWSEIEGQAYECKAMEGEAGGRWPPHPLRHGKNARSLRPGDVDVAGDWENRAHV